MGIYKSTSSLMFLLMIFLPLKLFANETLLTPEALFKLPFEELMNVEIVTAGKKGEKIGEIPASIVIVTSEEIKKMGYQSLNEIISGVTGYYTTDERTQTGSTLGVRGFWTSRSTQVLVMVNGIKQESGVDEGYPLTFVDVPIEAIDRIEIIRGPMSVIYGSGAFFGAINIITNKEFGSSEASVSIGNKHQQKVFLSSSKHLDDTSVKFIISAEKYDGDDIDYNDIMIDPNNQFANQSFEGLSTGSKVFEGDKVYIGTSITDFNNFYFDLNYAKTNRGFNTLVLPFPDNKQDVDISISQAKLGWKKSVSEFVDIDANITHSSRTATANYVLVSPDDYGRSHDETSSYDTELDIFIYPLDNLDLTLGLFYSSIYENVGTFDTDPVLVKELANQEGYLKDGDEQKNTG
jgi:outer membrane receptor for ferrienterochelin and colicins